MAARRIPGNYFSPQSIVVLNGLLRAGQPILRATESCDEFMCDLTVVVPHSTLPKHTTAFVFNRVLGFMEDPSDVHGPPYKLDFIREIHDYPPPPRDQDPQQVGSGCRRKRKTK